ncbi:hypothetical protein M0813_12453 [Anaeramoeba flamelloides]|uniref:Uncharacterized protein n=1 Tax=Anaeramoeba flamelloides TaxID=1746091 RepID=A0ABQ8ZC79_9EUKA|nr:hypothetical protein M0813_12453 [Anaeramoeba flamelloides]
MDFDFPSFEIEFDDFGSLDKFLDHNDFYEQDFCSDYFDKSIFASETNRYWWFPSEPENCIFSDHQHTDFVGLGNNENQYQLEDNFEKEKETETETEKEKEQEQEQGQGQEQVTKESFPHKKEGTKRGYHGIFVKEEPNIILKYPQTKPPIKNENDNDKQKQEKMKNNTNSLTSNQTLETEKETETETETGTETETETETEANTNTDTEAETARETKIETKSEYVTKPTHKLLSNFLTGIAKSPTNFTITIKPEPNPDFPLRKKQQNYPQPNFIVINDFDCKSKKNPKNETDQILKISKIRSWKEKLVLLQKTFPDLISGFSKQVYCLELGTNRPIVKINKQFFKSIREAKLLDPNNKKSKRSLLKDVQRCCVLHFNSKGYNQTCKNKFSHKWLEFAPSEYVHKPKKRRQTKKKKN